MLLASSILHSRISGKPTRGVMAMVCSGLFFFSLSSSVLAQQAPQETSSPSSSSQETVQQQDLPAPAPTYSFTVQPDEKLTAERPWSGEGGYSFWRATRQVIFDPTTYAPAIIAYQSTKLDWDTSQVFFRHGYVEGNPRFTVTGNPNDTPLPYGRGDRKILTDSLQIMGVSMTNNFFERTFEQMMIERFPNHPRLVKTLGWIERSAFASYWSYRMSANHFRQWKANERMANDLGLK